MSIFKILCISSHVIFQPNFLSSYLINISNFLLICSVFTIFKSSEVTQSCPTLCDPMDRSPPGSSVHEILQARILEWVAVSFSRGSSQPRDWTWVFTVLPSILPNLLAVSSGHFEQISADGFPLYFPQIPTKNTSTMMKTSCFFEAVRMQLCVYLQIWFLRYF